MREPRGAPSRLHPSDKKRLANLGLEPEEQFPARAGDKSHERNVVPPIQTNATEEDTIMEGQSTQRTTHDTTAPAGASEAFDAAFSRMDNNVQKLTTMFDKQNSFKADAYQLGLITIGVATGTAMGFGFVHWLTKPAAIEPAVLPAAKK